MHFEHGHIFIRVETIGFISQIGVFRQLFTEGFAGIQNALGFHHVIKLKILCNGWWQKFIANDSRDHHSRRVQRPFFIGPNHSGNGMLMRNVFFSNGCQYFHATHNSQDTVVVSAISNGVHMRCHHDSFGIRIRTR